jgi:simple sugar transport system ATP-binding protein
MDFSIAENLISERHSWRPFAYLGFLNPKTIGANAVRLIGQYDIRPSYKDIGVHALSGGNRQRVVVARAFSRQPKVLIVNQPTRGLDVAATTYIRQQILSERDRGAAILLISADLDEVIALSDRIAVMYEGRFVDIVDPRSASIEDIGSMMLGISVRKEEQV